MKTQMLGDDGFPLSYEHQKAKRAVEAALARQMIARLPENAFDRVVEAQGKLQQAQADYTKAVHEVVGEAWERMRQ